MSSRLNPYISFRDTARQAMEFYKSVFGGECKGRLRLLKHGRYIAAHLRQPSGPEASEGQSKWMRKLTCHHIALVHASRCLIRESQNP